MFKLSTRPLKRNRQESIIAFFKDNPYSSYSAKEIKKIVFKDQINIGSLMMILHELPMLENERTTRYIGNGIKGLYVFRWKGDKK